ncbi:hypothetical protein [Tenacibaculum sp. 190524A02b]|uniref:BioF2-like acetyltransferase domain-containing protein n=1 Tax=Tenacibaculum vairaonense TaxID=3137860 RepID=A0ABM9PHQ7_9FLAO
MISCIDRKDLDVVKYNDCIANSIQSNIFGFSWYLDIVTDNWKVLVLNDYEAVMPLPIRKKLFIEYVHPPFWLIQLGIYSREVEDENEFLIELFDDFKFVELRMNAKNSFSMFDEFQKEKQLQTLSLENSYESIYSNYKKDRKKDLRKAAKFDLTENWGDSPSKLIELFKNNVGTRTKNILEKDYSVLNQLIKACIEKKLGEVLAIYDKDSNLVASGFFLKYKGEVTILVSSTDFKNRNNGANTFLIDRAIYKYERNFTKFNFGGSSMPSIANYFKSLGGSSEGYQQLYYNNLPKLIKWIKR